MLFLGCVDAGALTGANEDAVNAHSATKSALLAMLLGGCADDAQTTCALATR
jgi:hypothetical protein